MTETKRCPSCNKSRHGQCHKGRCSCKCQVYNDTKTNVEPEPTQYTKKEQKEFEKLQENWRNRKK